MTSLQAARLSRHARPRDTQSKTADLRRVTIRHLARNVPGPRSPHGPAGRHHRAVVANHPTVDLLVPVHGPRTDQRIRLLARSRDHPIAHRQPRRATRARHAAPAGLPHRRRRSAADGLCARARPRPRRGPPVAYLPAAVDLASARSPHLAWLPPLHPPIGAGHAGGRAGGPPAPTATTTIITTARARTVPANFIAVAEPVAGCSDAAGVPPRRHTHRGRVFPGHRRAAFAGRTATSAPDPTDRIRPPHPHAGRRTRLRVLSPHRGDR